MSVYEYIYSGFAMAAGIPFSFWRDTDTATTPSLPQSVLSAAESTTMHISSHQKQTVGAAAALLSLQLAAAGTHRTIDLSDQEWTLTSPDNDESVPGKVPSHAHVDLFNAGVIQDPYE